MNSDFMNLPWHDAEILSLYIDRRDAGARDMVCMEIEWPIGGESEVVFFDCYAMSAEMNFGVLAPESILKVGVLDECAELTQIRSKWARVGVDLHGLRCFSIETNTTASKILIFAKGFKVGEVKDSEHS